MSPNLVETCFKVDVQVFILYCHQEPHMVSFKKTSHRHGATSHLHMSPKLNMEISYCFHNRKVASHSWFCFKHWTIIMLQFILKHIECYYDLKDDFNKFSCPSMLPIARSTIFSSVRTLQTNHISRLAHKLMVRNTCIIGSMNFVIPPLEYRSTIVGSSKNNSINKKRKNYKIMKT